MAVTNTAVISWFTGNIGKLTYSMNGSRNGSDGTADCSGSISQALINASGVNQGLYSTIGLATYLKTLGYKQVFSGLTAQATDVQDGDIILMSATSDMVGSGGSNGHVGVIHEGSNFISCTATRWIDGALFTKGQAIQSAPWAQYRNVTRLKAHSEIWRLPQPVVKDKLVVDGYDGVNTWKAVQSYLNSIGYHLVVDGIPGVNTIKALQQALNAKLKIKLVIDGIAGKATWSALQRLLGTPVDGIKSRPSQMVMAMQKALNSGKNWI